MEKLSIEKPKTEETEKKKSPEIKEVKQVKFERLGEGDKLIMETEAGPYSIRVINQEEEKEEKEKEETYLFVELKDDQGRKYTGKMLGGYEKTGAEKKNRGILDFMRKGDEEKLTPGIIKSGENHRLQFEDLEEIETRAKTLMLRTPTIKKISLIKKKGKK